MISFEVGSGQGITKPLQLLGTTRFPPSNTYVFDVTANNSVFVASGSNHALNLYDRSSMSFVRTLTFHQDNITKIKAYKESFLISSSKDGSIANWDLRTPGSSPVQIFKGNANEPLLAFDINNTDIILAAGTELIGEDAKILFWDVRTGSVVAEFLDSHSDSITQLKFHPLQSTQLLSGSIDGLICTFDISNFDEDEALITVMNSGSSINRTGYFGPNAEYVYCLNHMETFSLWSAAESNLLCDFGDIRRLSSYSDITLDYAIDCQYDQNSQRLFLLGGSNGGKISILHVAVNRLDICQVLQGGHKELVRGVYWDVQLMGDLVKTIVYLIASSNGVNCNIPGLLSSTSLICSLLLIKTFFYSIKGLTGSKNIAPIYSQLGVSY
ncbi:hypothetical protein G9A89_010885 [Geosiphon pyriformis]|nr:hypothetical protein G9A89_010885 [Geosiphon pyriformis]